MRALLSLIILFSTVISAAQSTNDSTLFTALKAGHFYVLNGTDTCFIERREDRQFEYCNGTEEGLELIVIWLKEDKYILRDIHDNPTNAPKVMRNDVVMTIIEIHQDHHIVHVRKKGQRAFNMTVYCLNP